MREAEMTTTDENKAARTEQSRQVAQDAAEAYKAAKQQLYDAMGENAGETRWLISQGIERGPSMRELRSQAKQLVKQGRELGIPRTELARKLGVSRQTIHDWINEGGS